jgi:hypothetical protein
VSNALLVEPCTPRVSEMSADMPQQKHRNMIESAYFVAAPYMCRNGACQGCTILMLWQHVRSSCAGLTDKLLMLYCAAKLHTSIVTLH